MSGDKYEEILRIGKKRGFLWPSYEIYGGVRGFISFGSLGSILKHNIENLWRRTFIHGQGFLEIETPILAPAKVFEASGHVEHFMDPMVECLSCKRIFKADFLVKEQTGIMTERVTLEELKDVIRTKNVRCPQCGGNLSDPQHFMTMFRTTIGPYAEAQGFGRPEAAQAMFVGFRRYYEHARRKLPFGVGQVGRCLRNEISPRQGPIRLREFTIMEVELFLDPNSPQCRKISDVRDDNLMILTKDMQLEGETSPRSFNVVDALDKGYIMTEWQAYFMAIAQRFMAMLNVPPERQRFREHLPEERAHYSLQTFDQEVLLERWGWIEVSGHSYRGNYDLTRHMERSGVDMQVTDEKRRKYVPHVIEPSFGSERIVYCVLEYALSKKEKRTIMRFPREISPIQVAVLPLLKKDGLPERAQSIYTTLLGEDFLISYDESGSIGRRYARADEIGVSIAVTVDYKTLEDGTVTMRDRDTWSQVRVKISELPDILRGYFSRKAEPFKV